MPILMTLRMRLPVCPVHSPDRTDRRRPPSVEHRVNLRHDVLAVDENALIPRRPQRHMQDRAIFADVDLLAGEHRVPPPRDATRAGEFNKQAHSLVGDAVLRIVEEQSRSFDREALARPGLSANKVRSCRSLTFS